MFYLLFVILEKLGHKEWWKWFSRAWKHAATILAMATMLHTSLASSAQEVNVDDARKVSREKNPIDKKHNDWKPERVKQKNKLNEERTEIEKLRDKLYKWKYGSDHRMWLFDGSFIGPNHKLQHGVRSFSTSWDYLSVGQHLAAFFVNLGYTADDVKLLKAGEVPWTHPYPLWCVWKYTIKDEVQRSDSVYSTKLQRWVVGDGKTHRASKAKLQIDSADVECAFAGLQKKQKVNGHWEKDSLIFPQVEWTGSWKDANNFDLVYEQASQIISKYIDQYDISKRQFSEKTPSTVKTDIIALFGRTKDGKASANAKKPSGTVFKSGWYEYIWYFGGVYRREIGAVDTTLLRDPEGKEDIMWKFRGNPVWHDAFQNDNSPDVDTDGLEKYVVLGYGIHDYTIPTKIFHNFPTFTKMSGAVIYYPGCEWKPYSVENSPWVNYLNGRLISPFFYERIHEVSITPYNDDGVTDRSYKVYVRSNNKDRSAWVYWAYVFCGYHSWLTSNNENRWRWWRDGKAFATDVDDFRKQYPSYDYRYYLMMVDAQTGFRKDPIWFINAVDQYARNLPGIPGKTMPVLTFSVPVPWVIKHGKQVMEQKQLFFTRDSVAILQPDGLIIPRKIQKEVAVEDPTSVDLVLTVLWKEVGIQALERYMKSNRISAGDVRRSNKEYKNEQEQKILDAQWEEKETSVVIFRGKEYDLENANELLSVSKEVEIALFENKQQIDRLTKDLDDPDNTDNVQTIKEKETKLDNLKAKRELWEEIQRKCNKYSLSGYEKAVKEIDKSIAFIEQQIVSQQEEITKMMYCISKVTPLEPKLVELENKLKTMLPGDSRLQQTAFDVTSLESQFRVMEHWWIATQWPYDLVDIQGATKDSVFIKQLLLKVKDMQSKKPQWQKALEQSQLDMVRSKEMLKIKEADRKVKQDILQEKKNNLKGE